MRATIACKNYLGDGMGSLTNSALVTIASVTLLLSALLLPAEIISRSPDDSLGELRLSSSRSVSQKYNDMLVCLARLGGLEFSIQSSLRQDALVENCQARAQHILNDAPTFASAHLTIAATARHLHLYESANAALIQSYEHAPSAAYLAARRITIALPLSAKFDLHAQVKSDLRLLFESAAYAPAVSDAFRLHPEYRPVISAALEDATPDAQRRFLALLRHEVKR